MEIINPKTIIEARGIEKKFGKLEVLRGVDLKIEEGEVVSVIGPSGSGKSTLLRCLNHLETVDNGTITIEDTCVVKDGIYNKTEDAAEAYKQLGMVFQNFNLFPHKSVMENIIMSPMLVNKLPRIAAIDTAVMLLKSVGLEDKQNYYPYQLSGGQQQRVAIARALAMHPKLMLFDEPTSALDPELTGEILKVIRQLAEKNTTMLIVTHEIAFARQVSDRIIFMADGVIVEQGEAKELIDNPRTERMKAFLNGLKRDGKDDRD